MVFFELLAFASMVEEHLVKAGYQIREAYFRDDVDEALTDLIAYYVKGKAE
jgi:hypothetical protein